MSEQDPQASVAPGPQGTAVFEYRNGELEVKLGGPLVFVEAAMRIWSPVLGLEIVGGVAPPAPPVAEQEPDLADAAGPEESEDLSRGGRFRNWYQQLIFESGRTWKRDHVLAFIYYATIVEGQGWASPNTIRWAFEQLGEDEPKALTQMLINIRKHHNWIAKPEEGTRGKHRLSKYGVRYIEKFIK